MVRWDENGLWLFTLVEFKQLPDGIELESIIGDKAIKGKDYIDDDTRGGYIAWGVRDPFHHELKELFIENFLKNNGHM